jgi:hypothetical protein
VAETSREGNDPRSGTLVNADPDAGQLVGINPVGLGPPNAQAPPIIVEVVDENFTRDVTSVYIGSNRERVPKLPLGGFLLTLRVSF